MLASIIVPVYRVEKYLDRCVHSLVEQSYRNVEIILVDDGSPDVCPQMCDLWAQRDQRVKVIHQQNGGLSSARNAGIEQATGDVLFFVDSDDEVSKDMVARVIHIFGEQDPDIVSFVGRRIDEDGTVFALTDCTPDGKYLRRQALEALLNADISNYACTKAFKRHLFSNVRFPVGRLWEDVAVMHWLFLNAKSVYCCSDQLYFYYGRKSSASKIISGKALRDIFLARHDRYIVLQQHFPEICELALPMAALAARRLYDRSLWEQVDGQVLAMATDFLKENKERVLNVTKDRKYWLYFNHPKIYRLGRLGRHMIGKLLKRK